MRRVVLKLSGEALASAASDETIDATTVDFLAREIAGAMERGGLELTDGRRLSGALASATFLRTCHS